MVNDVMNEGTWCREKQSVVVVACVACSTTSTTKIKMIYDALIFL